MAGARMLRLGTLMLALLVLGGGCRRSTALLPVTGKVSYRGTALTKGIVVFTPDASRGESGPIALGTIRDDGSYVLNTGDVPGAGPGWYRVTVAVFSAPAAQPAVAAPAAFLGLPEKYRDPELSMLRCQVKADQANTIDFHLD